MCIINIASEFQVIIYFIRNRYNFFAMSLYGHYFISCNTVLSAATKQDPHQFFFLVRRVDRHLAGKKPVMQPVHCLRGPTAIYHNWVDQSLQRGDDRALLSGEIPRRKSTAIAERSPRWNQRRRVRKQLQHSSWRTLDWPGEGQALPGLFVKDKLLMNEYLSHIC